VHHAFTPVRLRVITMHFSSLTSSRGLSNNPALFFLGTFMTLRSSTLNILLLSTDSEIQAHYKDLFGEQAVTIGRDGLSLPKDFGKACVRCRHRRIQKAQSAADLGKLFGGIDPARTLLSRRLSNRAETDGNVTPRGQSPQGRPVAIQWKCTGAVGRVWTSFLEHKVGDFVKGMRNGSGKKPPSDADRRRRTPVDLLTLRETKGNQIQAAELLGLNRNTLRKKILDLDIPVKRARAS
jgi:hypothetical protein